MSEGNVIKLHRTEKIAVWVYDMKFITYYKL